jgi:hypothetical protein
MACCPAVEFKNISGRAPLQIHSIYGEANGFEASASFQLSAAVNVFADRCTCVFEIQGLLSSVEAIK